MKIGIIGGIGPESTMDYYKSIIAGYQMLTGDGSYPEIVIDSINMTKMLGYMAQKDLDALIEMLLTAVGSLYRAEADLAVIASNTPHVVFDGVKERSPIPLLSIVEEAGKKAVSQGYTKVGLIGTGFTMKESFYKDTFGRYGIEVCVPPEEGQAYIHDKIYNELEFGIVKDTTKTEFLRIIGEMIKRDHIQALILGCTELPLILKPEDTAIPLLNTVQIHVESILKEMTTRK